MEKLSIEDKILGRKEPKPKTELELTAFTADTKYKVKAIGKDNESIMNGALVANILSVEQKQQIFAGDLTVQANGLEFTRIEPTISKIETVDEEISVTEEVKPRPRKRTK